MLSASSSFTQRLNPSPALTVPMRDGAACASSVSSGYARRILPCGMKLADGTTWLNPQEHPGGPLGTRYCHDSFGSIDVNIRKVIMEAICCVTAEVQKQHALRMTDTNGDVACSSGLDMAIRPWLAESVARQAWQATLIPGLISPYSIRNSFNTTIEDSKVRLEVDWGVLCTSADLTTPYHSVGPTIMIETDSAVITAHRDSSRCHWTASCEARKRDTTCLRRAPMESAIQYYAIPSSTHTEGIQLPSKIVPYQECSETSMRPPLAETVAPPAETDMPEAT